MPNYTVVLSRKAQKQLDKLPYNIAEPIINAIAALEENARPPGYKKLKGRDGYRIRTGTVQYNYKLKIGSIPICLLDIDECLAASYSAGQRPGLGGGI